MQDASGQCLLTTLALTPYDSLLLFLVGDSMEDVPANLAAKIPSSSSSGGKVITMDRRSKFSEKIFRLNGMELGHVITTLELKCPQALQEVDDIAQMEINVDAIPPSTFSELETYLQQKVPNKRRKMN